MGEETSLHSANTTPGPTDLTSPIGEEQSLDDQFEGERGIIIGQLSSQAGEMEGLGCRADKQGQKRVIPEEVPESANTIQPPHHASEHVGDNDEDPRPPTKRRRRSPRHPDQVDTHPHLGSLIDINDERPPLVRSDLVRDGQCSTSQTSRDPSPGKQSLSAAEFQEWPFQGSLKCTTIGNEIFYNVEFTLPRALGCISLPIDSMHGSLRDQIMPPSLASGRAAKLHPRTSSLVNHVDTMRAKWTPGEDGIIRRMKKQGYL